MRTNTLRKPNDYSVRMIAFLKFVGGGSFTAADMVANTNVPIYPVGSFLLGKMRQGFLRRTGTPGGRFRPGPGYKYRVIKLPTAQVSKGEVAKAVWDLLAAAKAPMRDRDILNALNRSRAQKLLICSVHTVTWRLYEKGAIFRTPKGHILNRSFKKRPPTTG